MHKKRSTLKSFMLEIKLMLSNNQNLNLLENAIYHLEDRVIENKIILKCQVFLNMKLVTNKLIDIHEIIFLKKAKEISYLI